MRASGFLYYAALLKLPLLLQRSASTAARPLQDSDKPVHEGVEGVRVEQKVRHGRQRGSYSQDFEAVADGFPRVGHVRKSENPGRKPIQSVRPGWHCSF